MSTDTDMDLGENPTLKEEVESTNDLKNFLVGYTGEKLKPEDNRVTVEMLVETMAEDFPEFLMAVAEENWVRGYHQALDDVDVGRTMAEDQENFFDPINDPNHPDYISDEDIGC